MRTLAHKRDTATGTSLESEEMSYLYRVLLLGLMQLDVPGATLRSLNGRKPLALLAYLARHEQPVPREHLVALL